ncbi:lysine decarboxylase-like protein-like protein [Amniculicola lignicola CBS 123094]|uniref:Lysine decarboxylase-like protein-like protein n=1 Tax=Amniculicola lignicola CBS 123094 TaxID=1392246 RepID=A0A6A5W8T9_9PLEO|nr:lysine decarboxylase-like protein-like protein [Amniculicola lignicola CBS 123094]
MATQPVVCVFCGASSGKSPVHLESARALARLLHENGIKLVYGGGTVGLMGEVARTLVSLSGPSSVHGIIPQPLVKFEQNHDPDNPNAHLIDESVFGRTTVVKDMHTRKAMMAAEVVAGGPGGGFVALSGGYGTLEELMEVTTWNQLGIHSMPVVVFNVDGYWDGLMSWVRNAVSAGFIGESNKGIMVEAKDADGVMMCLKEYKNAEGRFGLTWDQVGVVAAAAAAAEK